MPCIPALGQFKPNMGSNGHQNSELIRKIKRATFLLKEIQRLPWEIIFKKGEKFESTFLHVNIDIRYDWV